MPSSDPCPPSSSSALYKTLHTTALSFIHSLDQHLTPTLLNIPKIRALRTSNYTHNWGHNYHVSTSPHLQGTKDLNEFIAHMQSMLPLLESWNTEVNDVVVDEAKEMVVVRASYWMKVRGQEEVENDLVWWLWMEGGGERVEKAVEFLDGEATRRIGEIIREAKG
jgi:hypothetical protein